ncbi:MAG: AmmeMemoRadiSam system protein B [Bacteroidales bacterium]|nr:AmmeMemoRadiSam system protein B [Bacteroidales bacterium]
MQTNRFSFILLISFMFGSQLGCSSQNQDASAQKNDRKPAAAGRFYSDNPTELRSMLNGFFKEAIPRKQEQIAAIISPHAGYVFSGQVAANAFNQVDPDRVFDNVFVLASSHQVAFSGASIYNQGDYVTPLGNVPVNIPLANQLIGESSLFMFHPEADKYEHSLEVQVPFLQVHLKKPFQLVPIVLGTQSAESCRKIADLLKPWFNDRNLFVISSDFSHYPAYEEARAADQATCDAIVTSDPGKFLSHLDGYKKKRIPNLATNCCGWTSVLTLLYLTSGNPDYTFSPLFYRNSGDSKYGDKQQVVGYWAITVSRNFSLSDADKMRLLEIARNTVNGYIRDKKIPEVDAAGLSDNLKLHAGAFVTLKKGGALRGCIGRFTADIPLYKVIQEMAVASATQDYRFSPVQANEVDRLEIEISVISPMKKITDIDELELGRHGIYIKKGSVSGTFLPQVATETGWSKEEFLGHCARDKAGIGWDGWKDAELYTYEALVFSESELSGHKE